MPIFAKAGIVESIGTCDVFSHHNASANLIWRLLSLYFDFHEKKFSLLISQLLLSKSAEYGAESSLHFGPNCSFRLNTVHSRMTLKFDT